MKRIPALPVIALAAALIALAGPPPALAAINPAACGADRDTCIFEAISELEPGAVGQWTKSGKPRVAAIEAIAGVDITAAERDRLWVEYPAWKARHQALEDLRAALASAEAERDRYETDAARLQVEIDDLRIELSGANAAARAAGDDARAAALRAESAEAHVRMLRAGKPPCAAERGALAGKIGERWASAWRDAGRNLLACLAVGES